MEDYTNAIYEGKTKYVTNYTIDSNRHHLENREQYKIAIDPFDDKGIKDSNGELGSISETASQIGHRPSGNLLRRCFTMNELDFYNI